MKDSLFFKTVRYKFDNLMSRGMIALIGWLGLISLALVGVAAIILSIIGIGQEGEDAPGFIEAAWLSLMRTLDPGTMGGDTGWGFRIVMLMVTLGGIFIVSTLIGLLSSGISSKIDDLRKGRSFVIEKGHILILGWSEKIFPIISELIVANENQTSPKIVILGDKDKVEMEEELRIRIPNRKNMKIICRSGNPIDYNDLQIVNPNDAKAITILAPEDDSPDITVIKCILAITNNPERKKEKYHITAEISDIKNKDIANLVGGDEASLVYSEDLISRVIAQTCRQSGLSIVYTELLDFDGDEIYFQEEPALVGKTYKDSLAAFEKSSIIGIQFKNGECKINPSMDTVISKGDRIIAVSEDDDTIKYSELKHSDYKDLIVNKTDSKGEAEKVLIFSWNEMGDDIVRELDNYSSKGSIIKIVDEYPETPIIINELKTRMKHTNLECVQGDTTERETIEKLVAEDFTHIIILCDSDGHDTKHADAKALMTLLHLRDISNKTGKEFSIVSEMLDIRDKELAEVTKADDFIVSNRLVSLLMSQLTENKNLKTVFDDLFDADGSEIYLKPVSHYVKTSVEMDFYAVLESAAQKNQTALGYRLNRYSKDASKAYGVVVNPNKSDKIKFEENDKLVVLAED
jgi:Trk K+ transport system NAD-binding subunit